MTVVFETPGLIDVRSFTIMGAHAKPNSANPIGYFGTGLKYAIAVLVRLGAEPIIWIGKDRFSFSKYSTHFRGTALDTIKMKVLKDGQKRGMTFELPFTIQYGKNWGAWQAFRELESNTRDENGSTFVPNPEWTVDQRSMDDRTLIVVDLPEFQEAYDKRDEIFHPKAHNHGIGILEAFPEEGERLYYRGMRAYDLGKPSIFTYNLIEKQTLTEDRTLAYEFYAKRAVAEWVVKQANADQIEAILKADKDAWEFGLEFPSNISPSDAFREVMTERRRPISHASIPRIDLPPRPVIPGNISRNAHVYFAPVAREIRREAPRVTYEAPWRLTDAHPRPWRIEGLEVRDSQGNVVFAAPDGYYEDWDRTAEAILKRINIGGG